MKDHNPQDLYPQDRTAIRPLRLVILLCILIALLSLKVCA